MSGSGAAHKEMRVVLKEAKRLGWYIDRYSKHIQMKHPDGFHFTVVCTPKNATAYRKKALRDLAKFAYKT